MRKSLKLLTVTRARLVVLAMLFSIMAGVVGPIGHAWAVDFCRCVDHDCRKQVCLKPW